MKTHPYLKAICVAALVAQLFSVTAHAQVAYDPTPTGMVNASIDSTGQLQVRPSATSSQNDFDFFIGDWHVHSKALKGRLNNSHEWLTFEAGISCRKILRGLGTQEPYYATIDGQPFEGYTLRLFNPKTKLWSIYWSSSKTGTLDPPVVGSFENGVGRFYTRDVYQGKNIIMQFKWDSTRPGHPEWSQAFSTDNGKTWEWNWYMTYDRVNSATKP